MGSSRQRRRLVQARSRIDRPDAGCRLRITVSALAMVLLGVAVASGGLHGQGEPARAQLRALLGELRIDAPPTPFSALPFTLPDPSGKAVGLGDFRGRVVMLYFWTTY